MITATAGLWKEVCFMQQTAEWPLLTQVAEHHLMSHLVVIRKALVTINERIEQGQMGFETWREIQSTWARCLRAQSQWNSAYQSAQIEAQTHRHFAGELENLSARLLSLLQAFNG